MLSKAGSGDEQAGGAAVVFVGGVGGLFFVIIVVFGVFEHDSGSAANGTVVGLIPGEIVALGGGVDGVAVEAV